MVGWVVGWEGAGMGEEGTAAGDLEAAAAAGMAAVRGADWEVEGWEGGRGLG